jgi:hypothetical protein
MKYNGRFIRVYLWFRFVIKFTKQLDKHSVRLYNERCMEGEKKGIRVLFKIGFLYHKCAFDPLIEVFERDYKYDVWLSCKRRR